MAQEQPEEPQQEHHKEMQRTTTTTTTSMSSRKRVRFAAHDEDDNNSNNKENVNNYDERHRQSKRRRRSYPPSTREEMMNNRALWWQPDELASFRTNLRNLLLYGPSKNEMMDETPMTKTSMTTSETLPLYQCRKDDYNELLKSSSGLAHYDPDRIRHRKDVVRYIYNAQRHRPNDPEFMCHVSSKATQWSKQVAIDQAFRDYCDVLL